MFNTRAKKERSLGTSLTLKPFRGSGPKAAINRRPVRPGQHGAKRRRAGSEYSEQLAEKQKFQFSYGLREKNVRRLFKAAAKSGHEAIGKSFLSLLERRLDNTVYRLGLAPSRSVARQMIGHGHILVNGRRIKSSSHQVKIGYKIQIRDTSLKSVMFENLEEQLKESDRPVWLTLDLKTKEGTVVALPLEVETPFDISKVVDYYSKIIK